MNKTMKRNVVVSALLAIMLCVSLIAGATFALFTSESKTNVAVTSGKVDVVATMNGLTLYSPTSIDQSGNVVDSANAATATMFANGGTATADANTITLTNITPGDKVTFNIDVKNNSNVTVKYRTILACESDDGLFAGLKVTIDGETYDGLTKVSDYAPLDEAGEVDTVPVTIELPATAGNAYQDKTFKFTYKVEAVQGNTDTDNLVNIRYVYNARDLKAALTTSYQNEDLGIISLENDIDMTGWEPMILTYRSFVLNGNGYKFKNQTQPLARFIGVGTYAINDVNVDGANIVREGTNGEDGYASAFITEIQASSGIDLTISDCDISNSSITGYKYAGAIIAFASGANDTNVATIKLSGCDLTNVQVSTTDSSVGALIGHTYATTTIENCSVGGERSSVSCAEARNGNYAKAGAFVGTANGKVTISGTHTSTATLSNNNAKEPQANGLVGRTCGYGQVEMGDDIWTTQVVFKNMLASGTTDVTLTHNYYLGETNDTIERAHSLVRFSGGQCTDWKLNGGNHTVYGLTRPLISAEGAAKISISNLTIANANIKSTAAQCNGMGHAAFVGYMDAGANLTLVGCKLLNSTVEGTQEDARTGGLVGYVSSGTVEITDCVVESSTIKSADGASAIINTTYAETTISGCKVLGRTTITSTEVRNSSANTAVFVGSVQSGSTTTITDATVASTVVVTRVGTASPLHELVARKCSNEAGETGVVKIDGTNC